MKYKPYPAYKDSGVEWLGEVPEHWVGCRLKHALAQMDSGGTPDTSNLDYWSNGDDGIPWVAIGDMSGVDVVSETSKAVSRLGIQDKGLRVFPKGTLLFSMYASLGHVAELAMPATTNQAILGLIPDSLTNQAFLKRWLQFLQPYLEESASSNTQANLNAEKVRNLPFVRVSKSEQGDIATFLDRETAKLDTLIAKQEKLIELLQEKRQALISHAVTKGLYPDAPMKDSGVEWLGEVPEHWEVLPTKRIFGLIVDPAPENNDYELLSIYTDIGVRPRKELEEKGNKASTTDGYLRVKKGDFIVNKLLAWMGAIGLSQYEGVTSPAYDILRQKRAADPRFYEAMFRCGVMFTEFRRYSRGIMDMRLRLYFDEFGQIVIPYPPVEEQRAIADWIATEQGKIDTLIEKSRRSIELMREHRTALISAAVTGKIDVREAA